MPPPPTEFLLSHLNRPWIQQNHPIKGLNRGSKFSKKSKLNKTGLNTVVVQNLFCTPKFQSKIVTLLVLLTMCCTAMARTDAKEEYASNVLANKISESAEKEAREAFEQIQEPFKDISFEFPSDPLVDVQIKENSKYWEDKFYHITKSLGIHGVWIGADDSTPEITVNFNNYSVKVLDDFDGSSTHQSTLGAFYDNSEGKPNLINIINAKDFSIKRNIGTIIFASGSGTERGTVNVRTTDSIFLDTEKNNTTSLILNIGGSINLASKNIAFKAGDGGIIESTKDALTNIEAESLFIEREGGGPTATIRAYGGGNIEIRAKELYVKSIRSYLLRSEYENSKIDIKVDNAYFEGHINPYDKGEINIEGAKVYLKGDIFSQGGACLY